MAFKANFRTVPDYRFFLFFVCLLLVKLNLSFSQYYYADEDLKGDYCRTRSPQRCCPGRDDTCSAPILGTVCYCDIFCNRTSSADCCPDFLQVCHGIPPPQLVIRPECRHQGRYYKLNQVIRIKCNKCTCSQTGPTTFEFSCEQNVCLMRDDMIETVNRGPYGWQAANYSAFVEATLEEGISRRLGTFKPIRPTAQMFEIHSVKNGPLPEEFDARERWPNLIQPVRDQGDCAASWAFSTTAVASDRLGIESMGQERAHLSPQHLLSCQRRGQRGCLGGHLDKAWYFLRKNGASSEQCFPYTSGQDGAIPECPFKGRGRHVRGHCTDGSNAEIYKATPPYRVGPKEEEIMGEIYFNGPVQATFQVHEDFFIYRSGVYRHLVFLTEDLPEPFRAKGYHSVRIIGWGVDRSTGRPIKYWLCANSWGSQWGENGLFRILRGEDECDIEMFIVGVWAKVFPLNHH